MARKSSNKLYWISGGVLLVLIAALFYARHAGWIGQPKATEVEFSQAKRVDIIERISASGRVQPEVEVKLSPDVSGEIIELHVAEGDSVVKGQLLVKIRPDNYESLMARAQAAVNANKASYEQTKAQLAQTEARLIRAKANYDRNQKLLDDKVISLADFEQIKADYLVAKQDIDAVKASSQAALYNVKSAEAGLRDAAENLRKTTIFAPVNGIISLLNVEAGERVVGTSQMAGTELMRIANLTNMEVRINVNENDIVRVSLGDTAEIDVDAYSASGRKFKGVVKEIANTATGLTSVTASATSTDAITEFQVKVKILNESFQDLLTNRAKKSFPFKPGMTASVEVITDKKNKVIAVPISAVTTRSGEKPANAGSDKPEEENNNKKEEQTQPQVKEVVFVESEGKAALREVKTGISDFENIEILSGLKEGEKIISGPYSLVSKKLNEGDLVIKKKEVPKKDAKTSNEKSN